MENKVECGKDFLLVGSNWTNKLKEIQETFHPKSWFLLTDKKDPEDAKHPMYHDENINVLKDANIEFLNIAFSERTYGKSSSKEKIIKAVTDLPKPLVIQCNTTRRAGAVLTLYECIKNDLDLEGAKAFGTKHQLAFFDSPELVQWVIHNAPNIHQMPAFDINSKDMKAKKEKFMQNLGKEYGYGYKNGTEINDIRKTDFKRMEDQVYLDYTGSGQYKESQIRSALHELETKLFGNSHSHSPSSQNTEEELRTARSLVLEYFNADEEEYSVVFTSGATAALKIVGECFPFTDKSCFAFLNVNHNSVVGIREYAFMKNSEISPMTEEKVEECLQGKCNHGPIPNCCAPTMSDQSEISDEKRPDDYMKDPDNKNPWNLFCYPAEDNFCGVKYPLEWIDQIQDKGLCGKRNWCVMLDAAAFVPTQPLDLQKYRPSFVDVSFYKIFGYPSGLGALIVRNDSLKLLHRTYFGGGTIILATIKKHFVQFARKRATRFEDGTSAFLSIASLKYGFEAINQLKIENISNHCYCLSKHLYTRLHELKHHTGKPVTQIFGKWGSENEHRVQGPIVTFVAFNSEGTPIGYHGIQIASANAGFHIRTGAHCNPGGVDMYLNIGEEKVEKFARKKTSCGDDLDVADGCHLGTVRVSIGAYSTFEDVERFCSWFESTYCEMDNIRPLRDISLDSLTNLTNELSFQ